MGVNIGPRDMNRFMKGRSIIIEEPAGTANAYFLSAVASPYHFEFGYLFAKAVLSYHNTW